MTSISLFDMPGSSLTAALDRAAKQDSRVEYELLPYTVREAEEIKGALKKLLSGANSQGRRDQLIRSPFSGILAAARRYEASRVSASIPLKAVPQWRPRLRRLKRYPSGATALLREEFYAELLLGGLSLVEARRRRSDWRERLANDHDLLFRVIDALLEHPMLSGEGGREEDSDLTEFVAAAAHAYEEASGKPVRRSVSYSATNRAISGKPRGPALRLIALCVRPLVPALSDEALADHIRRLQRGR